MTELPRVPREDIILLTAHNWYDGPLEGELEWGGKRYWFQVILDHHEYYPNQFEIVDLTPEKWAEIDVINELFYTHVGRHWDYDRETQKIGLQNQRPHGGNIDDYCEDPRVMAFENPEGPIVGYFTLYEKRT